MTIKEFFPNLTERQRFKIGLRFATRYKAINNNKPPDKILEDGFNVCNYDHKYLIDSMKIFRKRIRKRHPGWNIEFKEPTKRKRITASKVQKVNL